MDNQRIFLFAILSVLILMLWSEWESERRPETAPAAMQAVPATPAAPGAPGAPAKSAATTPGAAQLESGERIQVITDLLQVEIDTQGGDVRMVELRKHSVALDQPGTPFRLLEDRGARVYVAQSGLIGHEGAA